MYVFDSSIESKRQKIINSLDISDKKLIGTLIDLTGKVLTHESHIKLLEQKIKMIGTLCETLNSSLSDIEIADTLLD